MLAAPAEGISLDDKIAITRLLLRSGLPIADLNAIRKHLSAIKGGRLAAAAGRSMTFAISDVHAPVEHDPAVIGSGPTVPDPSTFADAIAALRRGSLWDSIPETIKHHLESGARGERAETIKPGDRLLERSAFVLAGSRRDAVGGAASEAGTLGYHLIVLDPPTLGEARDAAKAFCREARERLHGSPRPACVIAAGETTVTVTGTGTGGRNQEFALAAVTELDGLGAYACASVGTDGIDGPTTAAGAQVDSTTIARAGRLGLDRDRMLRNNDSYAFFEALDDLVVTGPTGTNVGDLQLLLVE